MNSDGGPMLSFQARIDVSAEPVQVWQTLLATDRWPVWDDAIQRVEGRLVEGGDLTLWIEGQRRPFRLRVAHWEPSRRLVLQGGMPLGLFRGTRTYTLDQIGDRTRLEMEERFTGPLAPLIGRTIPDLQPSFDAFVAGLRKAAESPQASN